MRHATGDDLARLTDLLGALRSTPGLVERRPGAFSWRGKAFLHVHADGDDLYVDAKLDGERFERVRVTTTRERRAVASRVRALVSAPGAPGRAR